MRCGLCIFSLRALEGFSRLMLPYNLHTHAAAGWKSRMLMRSNSLYAHPTYARFECLETLSAKTGLIHG